MNKVTIYRYDENKPVRTLNLNGEPWFVLRDVCEVLGLGNSRMVADRLDEDEKLDYQRVRPVQRHPAQR